MHRLLVPARVVACVLATLSAVALLGAPGAPFGAALAHGGGSLALTGDLRDLAVGAPGTLRVVAANSDDRPVAVATVTATVTGGPDGCLAVTAWTGSLAVPARGTSEVVLDVALEDLPQCGGSTWSLEYAAS